MVNRETPAGSAWGEVVYNSASDIYTAIVDNTGSGNLYINQTVIPTTGDKGKEATAFTDRVGQDTDQTSSTLATYAGNGRRKITVMVNGGFANAAGVAYSTAAAGDQIGIRRVPVVTRPSDFTQADPTTPGALFMSAPLRL